MPTIDQISEAQLKRADYVVAVEFAADKRVTIWGDDVVSPGMPPGSPAYELKVIEIDCPAGDETAFSAIVERVRKVKGNVSSRLKVSHEKKGIDISKLAIQPPTIPAVSKVANVNSLMANVKPPRNALLGEAEANYASEFHKRLEAWISSFEKNLDDQHEVGVRLVSFGQTVVFHLEKLGYWNPSLISFKGVTDNGDPVELIQHVSQISLLLMKVPKQNADGPKRQVGFQ